MREDLKIAVKKLRYICDSGIFQFKNTSEIESIKGFIGQERAVRALRFGLEIDNHHHIFITGDTGKGKKRAVICEFLEEFAEEKAASGPVGLKDFCYVHNFSRPDQPRILIFESGQGRKFKLRIEETARKLEKEIQEKIKAKGGTLNLAEIFKDLFKEYAAFQKATDYLMRLYEYVLSNIDLLCLAANSYIQPNGLEEIAKLGHDPFSPFAVNLFIDNCGKERAPVIFESNPSFTTLFGEIEKRLVFLAQLSDHTCLKAGSLCLANGGYLVLNAMDVLENPGVWTKLKNTLRHGYLKIEDPLGGLLGLASGLDPEPVPINLKVILIGNPEIYYALIHYDPDFQTIFKVKAEFDSEIPLTRKNLNNYAAFISSCCQKENLPPFKPSGAAKIAEYAVRLAGKQKKLSTKFDEIQDLIIEASYWAKKVSSPMVGSDHVKKAIAAQRLRVNLIEEKVQELIKSGILMIDVRGREVGQVNALAVYSTGDCSFGVPSKITAKTFFGKGGVISIDREVKMSGPIHDKGVKILQGYFNAKYGKYRNISFSASICFEQSYEKIEGDSASAAELFCLISSLSELPINQGLAVTGSVNQNGEIQPIGGVNEKIEGFFDVCKRLGLKGGQGVIIPHQNMQNLALREDIVESVASGDFSIYSIRTIEDGLEILTDASADDIDKKIRQRLSDMIKK